MRVCLLALTACSFHAGVVAGDSAAPIDSANASGWLRGYRYRKPITITAAAALASFPVSVLEAQDTDLAAHALGGTDLVFTADDGITVLPSELVELTQSTGALDAWTRLSLVDGSVVAYLYYGAPPPSPVAGMWAGYVGVWHMSGTVGESDSSSQQNDLSPSTTVPASVAGVVGDARSYDGVHDALVTGIAEPSLQFGTGSFSYEMWLDATDEGSAHSPCPLWQGGASNTNPGYDFQLNTDTWGAELVDTTGNLAYGNVGSWTNLGARWVQLAAVLDRNGPTLVTYANGALVGSMPVSFGSLDSSTQDFEVGRNGDITIYDGSIDEVRVIGSVLSADWIAAEYANVATRASFITIGREQDSTSE
jgi:hypothetical protein